MPREHAHHQGELYAQCLRYTISIPVGLLANLAVKFYEMPEITTVTKAKSLSFRKPYPTAITVPTNPLVCFELPQGDILEVRGAFAAKVDRKPPVVEFLKLALPLSGSFLGLPGNLAHLLAYKIGSPESQVFVLVDRCNFVGRALLADDLGFFRDG